MRMLSPAIDIKMGGLFVCFNGRQIFVPMRIDKFYWNIPYNKGDIVK